MRYKRKTYSGVVLEQEVYSCSEGIKSAADIEKKLKPPKTEEEKREANERHARKRMIRNMNATFVLGGLYVTLTYDDKYLPTSLEAAKKELDNYIRRLQRKFPELCVMAVTGKGSKSGRLHHHMVIKGAFEKDIIKKWGRGSVTRIEPLRSHNVYNGKDHGRDYTGLACYLFRHAESAGQTRGKRWKQTKNVMQPEAMKPKEIKRNYSVDKPPITPKGYELVEAREGISGYIYYKYIKILS